MGFEIRINGEVVHEVDIDARYISAVHVRTDRGESSATFLDVHQNHVDLSFDYRSHTDGAIAMDDAARLREEKAKAAPLFPNEVARQAEEDRKANATEADEVEEETSELETSNEDESPNNGEDSESEEDQQKLTL